MTRTEPSAAAMRAAKRISNQLSDGYYAPAPLAAIIDAETGDDPEMDATDFAHPAWWRGHDYTTAVFCQKVNEILDGKDDGSGVSSEPWEWTKRRLRKLRDAETGQERFQLVAALRGLLQSYVANSQYCECNGINVEDDPAVAVARDVLARVEGQKPAPVKDCQCPIEHWQDYPTTEFCLVCRGKVKR